MTTAPYSRVPVRPHSRYLGGGIFLLLGLVVLLAVTNLVDDVVAGLLLTFMLVMLMFPFSRGYARGTFNLFEPVSVTAIMLLFAYPLQVLYVSVFPDHSMPSVVRYWEDGELLRRGLWYCTVGFAVYLLAYYGAPRVVLQIWSHPSPNSNLLISGWRITVVFLVGWLFRVIMIVTGNFGTFYTWTGYNPDTATFLWTFSHLTWFAYILAWVSWLQTPTRRTTLILVLAMTLVEGGYHLVISASKTFLAYLFLFPIMAASLVRRRIPSVAILGCAIMLIFFVFPFIAQIRLLHGDWKPEGANLASQVEVARQAARNSVDYVSEAPGQSVAESLFGRLQGFDSLMVILNEVPEKVDYLYGRDLLLLPFALVPRVVFPWKPESQWGEIFSFQIYKGGSSVSPYPIGEGYFNGGWIGVVVLMATLGFLQRWYYSSFYKPREERVYAIAAYIYLFFSVTNFDSSLITGYVALAQNAAILTVVFFLLFRPTANHQKKVSRSIG